MAVVAAMSDGCAGLSVAGSVAVVVVHLAAEVDDSCAIAVVFVVLLGSLNESGLAHHK